MSTSESPQPQDESSQNLHNLDKRKTETQIEIDGRGDVCSVAFFADGEHFVSGGWEGKIRCWATEDGREVGMPVDAGDVICNIAVSQDGEWIVSGTYGGFIVVWSVSNAEDQQGAIRFKGHGSDVHAVDISPDGTRIATGSLDCMACIWSIPTCERLLDPLMHDSILGAIRFSPDGSLIATATWDDCVRIYDSKNGDLFSDVPIRVASVSNQSLVWCNDSKHLFALCRNGNICSLDLSRGAVTVSQFIESGNDPLCFSMANNGAFIAVSANKSISFWDTNTRKPIVPVIQYTNDIRCMAISAKYEMVISGGSKIARQSLRDILPSPYCNDLVEVENADKLPHAQEESSDNEISRLKKVVQQLHTKLADRECTANQEKDALNKTIESLHSREKSSSDEISHLKMTVHHLRTQLAHSQQIIHAHEQKHQCETLYAGGNMIDAASFLREFTNSVPRPVKENKMIMNWIAEFTNRCISALETIGDDASSAGKYEDGIAAYSAALSLGPPIPYNLLSKWANVMLHRFQAKEVLDAAFKFKVPRVDIYREICAALEEEGRVVEAVDLFQQMQMEPTEDESNRDERLQWEVGFRWRCIEKLEKLGDAAMESQDCKGAFQHYSIILSLDAVNRMQILIKRSKAAASIELWEEALANADEAIKLDPLSHEGYERKYAALHGEKRYAEAIEAFHTMLSKLDQSPDRLTRELRHRYIDTKPTIQRIAEQVTRYLPHILIYVPTGRLYDKKQQVEALETDPIYYELVSSMITQVDEERILNAVKGFYRYVMFSHKWQETEPTFQLVENTSVYQLSASPGSAKLKKFCELVRSLQFQWAWSDTCCINQLDKGVQQESLVAMFRWYRGSSLTIVHLLGVWSNSQEFGCLWRSIWNTRGWTYQEYVASQVVQFYTEDWKPYLGLEMFNHKESPTILSEMEHATNFTAHELAALHPGLDRVREKLYLASKRETTREEDVAYSLFGIFNVALPVIYGEGNQAVGRLLEHILTGSGDVTILAWAGSAGSYNSCLPTDITVYDDIVPLHVPTIEAAEMDRVVTELRSPSLDFSLLVSLYDGLQILPPPTLSASRLRLPGLVFRLTELFHISDQDAETKLHVYRTTASAFGDIKIRTADDLKGKKNLLLVHPWIRPLLYQEFSDGASALDATTQALRLLALLKQPFGALLFEPVSWVEYRRVAADSLIVVRFREGVSLSELVGGIRTIEIR